MLGRCVSIPRARAIANNRVAHVAKKKKKKCQSVVFRGIGVQPGGDPRELAVYLSGRPLLSRAIDLPDKRFQRAVRARVRSPSTLRLYRRLSLSLSLSLSFSRPSTFVLIPITRSEISRTTSGSRGSRSCVHCTNLTTNRLVPSVSHPPIERPTNLASNHPHVHVRANTYANVLCYVPYRDENTFRGWRRASSVDRPGPYTHSTPRMPSRSPATFSV